MVAWVTVDRHHTQAGLGVLAQSGIADQMPIQGCLSAVWLSTFTCG
ncbi:MAG: hypothetical protein WB801_09625 [Candidatus Dormiibacterota bacterium]